MQSKARQVILSTIFLVTLIILATPSFGVLFSTIESGYNTSAIEWWPMFHHDLSHTAYSSSKAPSTNQTLWISYPFIDWTRSSPVVENNLVFVGTDENLAGGWGAMRALNVTNGKSVWNYSTGGDVYSTGAVAGGRLYFGCNDKKLYCLTAATGSYVWHFLADGEVDSSPCIADGKVLFGSATPMGGKFYCLDAVTGASVWNFSTLNKVHSSPIVANGRIYFGSEDGRIYSLNLTTGAQLWVYSTSQPIVWKTSPAFSDNRLYATAGATIICLNSTSGSSIWSYTAGSMIYSSVSLAYGNLYVGSDDFKMYCLNATTGSFKWSFSTGDKVYSSAALAQGRLFFGSFDNKVYCLNASTGAMIWSYQIALSGCRLYSSPAIADATLFISYSYGTFAGKLLAFKTPNRPPTASNLFITPSLPVTNDNLVGHYDYSDPDGDTEDGTEVRWYKNNLLQPAFNDTLTITNGATTRGEKWNFTVRPKDGTDFGEIIASPVVTIQNTRPTIATVLISPNPAYTNTSLTATPSGWIDPDNDPQAYSFQWQKWNGTHWQDIPGATSSTLNHTSFKKADQIKVECTPYDGFEYGEPKNQTITISNTPPQIANFDPVMNPIIQETESQLFVIEPFDLDEEPISASWLVNGSDVGEHEYIMIFHSNYDSAGVYNITVVVTDGTDTAKHEWTMTVINLNRPPFIREDLSFPSTDPTIEEGQSQMFNVSYTDPDGDPTTVQWYLNSTPTTNDDYYMFTSEIGSRGIHNVTVIVSDGDLSDSYMWWLNVTPLYRHDIAVMSVVTSKGTTGLGYTVNITAFIENRGEVTENVSLSALAMLEDSNVTIGSSSVLLSPDSIENMTFQWNTSSLSYGNYTIFVYAEPVEGEKEVDNNANDDCSILVTISGDINGDQYVNAKDAVILGMAFYPTGTYNPNADINDDGYVNAKDAVILGMYFGDSWI